MNISIDNYSSVLSQCERDGSGITLGYEFTHAQKILNDKDFDIFLSDSITHEFIHAVLIKQFDITTSKLFDIIEHHLCNYDIKERIFRHLQIFRGSDFPMTWHNSILSSGIQEFFKDYCINTHDLKECKIICNRRD